MGHGGLAADQAQQGQTQNGFNGMAHSSGHAGVRILFQALDQRLCRIHINTPSVSLSYLCKPPEPTFAIVLRLKLKSLYP